jgi:peptidoglycan/LPS O-acetylase OafA/YrhL
MSAIHSAAPSQREVLPTRLPGATDRKAANHLVFVDSMRGVAVCGVVAVHLAVMLNVTGMLGTIMHLGMYGVQLFYLVSALTLMMSMAKRNRLEAYPTLNFFIRRFFRIAPAFYLTILVYCLWNGSRSTFSFRHLLLVMAFLNGWRPDLINNAPVVGQWSIAVEMTFYLVLPWLFAGIRSFRSALVAWYMSIAFYPLYFPLAARLAVWEGFAHNNPGDFGYYWFPSQFPIFLTGMALYFILKENRDLWRSILPFVPGGVFLIVMNFLVRDPMLTPVVGLAGVVLVALTARHSLRIIVNRYFARMGEVSFSAYLCHPLVVMLIMGFFKSHMGQAPLVTFTLAYAVTLAIVFAISYVSWTFIEKPGQRLGKFCIHWIASRREPAYANTRLN